MRRPRHKAPMPACYIRYVITESNLPVSWRTRARGFTALMGLYESNYLRLEALAGPLAGFAGERRSRVPGDCELVLALRERSPYTLELSLTYLLPCGQGQPERVPDLVLRLYCDARLLEVATGRGEAGAAGVCGLEQRWLRNTMLNKWLDYCAGRGHSFLPAASR
jgi:uncharacterized protein YqiB (DUF1249 family)